MTIENLTGDIRKRAAWSIFMGVLTALLGVFLIAYPLAAATITTFLFGLILTYCAVPAGPFRGVAACNNKTDTRKRDRKPGPVIRISFLIFKISSSFLR